jgi:asparagine synthase (glutamine-hydrolysing)
MCGITGFFAELGAAQDNSATKARLKTMTDAMTHRGPDAEGLWVNNKNTTALGHRRLAIVDLSEAGAQPMESQHFVLVFNGEIYNFRSIRNELEVLGQTFQGHSDTEVLLFAIEQWGLENTLEKLEGMFAFCAYNKQTNTAYLVRDRMGEKPLYYSKQNSAQGKRFFFGSELKTLKANTDFQARLDQRALSLYITHNCVPAPYSIYQDCYKLLPGQYLQLNCDTLEYKTEHYWSSQQAFINGANNPLEGSPTDAANALEAALTKSIKDQMLADVPLGAFLSGGIDSSTVTAIMQAQSNKPINTYSIGFDFAGFNEAEHAKAIAKHLGTEHTEFYVSEQDTKDVIPKLASIYCEPFADSSQIPTFLVCKLAKQHVTVALSGDGGDELFAGYSRYEKVLDAWRKNNGPSALEKAAHHLPKSLFNTLISLPLGVSGQYPHFAAERLHSNYYKVSATSFNEFYRRSISFWQDNAHPLINHDVVKYSLTQPSENAFDKLTQLQYLDTQMYMPDDILTKVDRAGMAVSLETRIPLLNHKIVELAARIPSDIRTHNGVAKWPLQEVLSRYVPRELFDRPKQGFAIPIGEWLRGPLKGWMTDLISPTRIRQQGLFDYKTIYPMLKMHLDGNSDYSLQLWSILMFQSWVDHGCIEL